MCGINGFIGDSKEAVASMNEATRHRGPDDTGVFSNGSFTIGNNRLAIIDLSPLGHQPMISQNGRFSIVYNGEIYNHKSIRTTLEGEGIVFKGHSDTEVILEGFAKWGQEITDKLRGMWAFAILDSEKNELFLSRDPFGIKPLYIYRDGSVIGFSSEIRGLLANQRVSKEIDPESARQLIVLGHILAPRTILKNASALLPGEEVTVNLKTLDITSRLKREETDIQTPPSDSELEGVLLDSLKCHLESDVPVGLFFSGGTDSTILALLLKKLGVSLSAYHVAIQGRSDTEYARTIAKKLSLPLTEIQLDPKNLPELYEGAWKSMDQPLVDTSFIPTSLIAKRAQDDVKVILSGEGGDELLGGYTRHTSLHSKGLNLHKTGKPFLGHMILTRAPWCTRFFPQIQGLERLWAKLFGNTTDLYLSEIAIGLPFNDSGVMANALEKRLEQRETPDGVLAFDRLMYLPDTLLRKIDNATMTSSVEGRVPFLDRKVWKHISALSIDWKRADGISKAPLKRILRKYLPPQLVDRPKTGFSLPLDSYFLKAEDAHITEAVMWYRKKYTGLIPALDSVLNWGFETHRDILNKKIGYSLFAIVTLWGWAKAKNLL